MAKVTIDKSKCIGCGICASVCPDGFRMAGAKAEVKNEDADCVKEAADSCSVQAIILDNGESEEPAAGNSPVLSKESDENFQDAGSGRGFGRGRGMGQGRGMGGQGRGMGRGFGRGRGLGREL